MYLKFELGFNFLAIQSQALQNFGYFFFYMKLIVRK